MIEAGNLGNIRTKKALIRKEILAKRRGLTQEECAYKSQKICDRFLSSDEYKNAATILLYKAYNNEVDTDPIFEKAHADGKTVAYPLSRILGGEPTLDFYIIEDNNMFKAGYKGISEPDTGLSPICFTERADICVTPGVAFDRNCHRIGYGKAFYDRFIRMSNPGKVIGLAYDLQITDDIETEESDRALDMVITDTAVYRR